MSDQTTNIQVVLFGAQGRWIAQCLEYDLCTSSENLEELPKKIARQLRLQVALDRTKGRKPFEGFSRSPQRFWDLYEQATPYAVVKLKGSIFSRTLQSLRIPSLQTQLSLAGA